MQKQLSLLIIILFLASLPVRGGDLYTYSQKANESFSSGNYKQAIYYYDKLINLKPEDDRLYYNLALAYKKSNQLDLALKSINKAIEMKPDNKDHLMLQANLYGLLNKHEKSLNIYKELYKRFSGDKQVVNNLGYYFFRVIKKSEDVDFDKTIQYATEAVDTFPEDLSFLQKLAILYLESKNYGKALGTYKKILRLDPANKTALSNSEYIMYNKKSIDLRNAIDRAQPSLKAPKKLYKLVKVKKGVNPQIRQKAYYLLDLIYSDYEGRILLENVKKKKIKIYITPNGKNAHKAFALKKTHTFSVYGVPLSFTSDTINIEEDYINRFFDTNLDPEARMSSIVVIVHEACHAVRSALRKNKENSLEEEITSSIIGLNIAHKLILNRTLTKQETYRYAKGYLIGSLSDDHAKLRPYNGFSEFIELDLHIKIPYNDTFKDLSALYKEVKDQVKYTHTDLEYGNRIYYSY